MDFRVLYASGPEHAVCVDGAITTARLTGSVGATYSIGGDNTAESSATVTRADAAPSSDALACLGGGNPHTLCSCARCTNGR